MTECAPLPETMSYLLAQVCKLHRQRADDLTQRDRAARRAELGAHLGVQPATVTNALKRLERKGLVERMPDTEDQRVSRVFPTAEGRQRRADVEAKWDQLERTSFAGISGPERDLLHGLLSKVRQNLAVQRSSPTFSAAGPAQGVKT